MQEMRIMSDFTISSAMPPLQTLLAAAAKQPNATSQATAIKAVSGMTDQLAATLATISSGVDIQA
jgi:hypothetical protein